MQTKEIEKDTAAVSATRPGEPVRPRARRLTAILVGLAAIVALAVGVAAAGDDPTDGPSEPPTTQVIPFVSPGEPAHVGGGVDG